MIALRLILLPDGPGLYERGGPPPGTGLNERREPGPGVPVERTDEDV